VRRRILQTIQNGKETRVSTVVFKCYHASQNKFISGKVKPPKTSDIIFHLFDAMVILLRIAVSLSIFISSLTVHMKIEAKLIAFQ